jgi:hypothetical protein
MEPKHKTLEPNHPNNVEWEALDYSDIKNQDQITKIINSGRASQKTIIRILETAGVDTGLLDTCYHEYAYVENMIETIQRVKKHQLAPYQRRIINSMIDSLFSNDTWTYNKYAEFVGYLKINYDIDMDTMPAELIKQMLQIEDIDDGYTSNPNIIRPV